MVRLSLFSCSPAPEQCVDPESRNGLRLLCRTEFHGQVEFRTSCLIARRGKGLDEDIPQAKLVHGQLIVNA